MNDDGLIEEPGEGYFASVSDLMVGVLFVFLLLLTAFALNYRDDTTKLQDVIARLERAEKQAEQAKQDAIQARLRTEQAEETARLRVAEAARLREQNERLRTRLADAALMLERELRSREEARAGMLQRLKTRLESGGIVVELDGQSGVLHLSDAVLFQTNRSDLADAKARGTVEVLARGLAEVLPCFSAAAERAGCQAGDGAILETVLIEGHTDNQPFLGLTAGQSQAENDRLSTARALTVFTSVRQGQPALEVLRNPAGQPLLGISGYGQRRPRTDTGNNLALDRRIDLRFVLSARTSDELRKLLEEIKALGTQAPP